MSNLRTPAGLLAAMRELREHVIQEGEKMRAEWAPHVKRRDFRLSGMNLAYYLALRRRDLRELQNALSPWGLSSLGRSEARVLPNLDQVIMALEALAGERAPGPDHVAPERRFYRGQRLLQRETLKVLGPAPAHRYVRIMVTLPGEAAGSYDLIRDLVAGGMDIARINCAHDGVTEWEAMCAYVRRASAELGRPCRVYTDLGGPKVRTGDILASGGTSRLKKDHMILLTRSLVADVRVKSDLQVTCQLPEIIGQLKQGDTVWIDDGKLGARVEERMADGALLRVTHVGPKGAKVKPDKGVNFPDTELEIDPLTEKDMEDLDFVAPHADVIGYSFVQSARDMGRLQSELEKRGVDPITRPVVAKIETARAVRNLPGIIARGAGRQPLGVMIARGDLFVEIGHRRMSEMQEELLWLCEAAHVPVIWATQVLESLVKKGSPSRAEITDAAMGCRAECVMLNKGPYILEGMATLDDVLTRMIDHQSKKMSTYRALKSW